MENLIRYVAESLVEKPEEVEVTTEEEARATIITLQVSPDDTGRVIGRRGRVANALRTLLRASRYRDAHPVILEIE